MNDSIFWDIIERTYKDSEAPDPYEALERLLEPLNMVELFEFDEIFSRFQRQLSTPRHLAAAFLIHEGALSDESFIVYTAGLVAVPKTVYDDIVIFADRILDHSVCEDVLNLDSYPFESAAPTVGDRKYGRKWFEESKRARWQQQPVNINDIELDGVRGYHILTKERCQSLVPRIFEKYSGACEWVS